MELLFDDADALRRLEAATPEALDRLPFGVIGLNPDGAVAVYNATEARGAGLTAARVIGRPFFTSVGPCMNNYLVAERFEAEATLDATLDYVFTFVMRPTPVRLRLLKAPDAARRWLLVERRSDHGG